MGNILNIFVTRIALFLTTLASVSVIFLITLPKHVSPADAFEPYADILPGNSLDAALEHGFKCQLGSFPSFGKFCLLIPETGVFSEIEVRIPTNTGQISQAVFKPREKTLTLGDLVLLWGKPEVAAYAGIANFRWRNIHVVAIPQNYRGHFSYLLPITYIAFESAD